MILLIPHATDRYIPSPLMAILRRSTIHRRCCAPAILTNDADGCNLYTFTSTSRNWSSRIL